MSSPVVDDFEPLRVKQVVRETRDAMSLVFDVPAEHRQRFRYQAGQFLTVRVTVDGQQYRRCYSMSSSPALQQDLRVTVKRDGDGVVSNWMNDHVAAGDHLEVGVPDGRFVRSRSDRELVAFAGGSGITPVFSLIQTALAEPDGRVRLFYANRAAESIIFDDALTGLAGAHGDRFGVEHHLDVERGVVTAEMVKGYLAGIDDLAAADFYVCGPAPFMDTVEQALLAAGVPASQIHLERFSVAPVPVEEVPVTEQVTIELDRQVVTVNYRAGHTLLQMARMAGLKAPSSCETGSCGTCIAQVTEGSARLLNNDALDEDEVADGLVVTCQALPTSRTVRFVYE